MKLLTLNTHSIAEPNYYEKMLILSKAIASELPDVVALQEVNQTIGLPPIKQKTLVTSDSDIRKDNYAEALLSELKKLGVIYHCVWLPIKIGYDKYDEGLAVLSRYPILDTDNILISKCNDYSYWKTRRVVGIKNKLGWFYSVHMGWWNDEEEPFKEQWNKLNNHLNAKENIWLMGDFNSDANEIDGGYSLVKSCGWYDSFDLAKEKDNGFTVTKKIDGWKDKDVSDKRIDYIFCNYKANVTKSTVVFNGANYDIVSDHFGVMIEVE